MALKKQKHLNLIRDKNLTPKIALFYSQMTEIRNSLNKFLQNIDDDVIDFSPFKEKIETIGTLCLHIAAVERFWIYENIDGKELNYSFDELI